MILLSFSAVLIQSCSDEDGFDCFTSTGEVKLESRPTAPFHFIELHDNINLILTQDSVACCVEVEAGENLLAGITSEVERGRLVLRNENKCDWVRSFEVPVNVYITFSRLDTIVFRAAGNLSFTNAWRNDSIQFDVWEGAGTIDLKLDVFKSRVYIHYGVTEVIISGWSQVNYISSKGYGPVDALGLQTNYTFMSTQSPNDCFVYVTGELGATLSNIGNIYYKGHPGVVTEERQSSGRLIPLD